MPRKSLQTRRPNKNLAPKGLAGARISMPRLTFIPSFALFGLDRPLIFHPVIPINLTVRQRLSLMEASLPSNQSFCSLFFRSLFYPPDIDLFRLTLHRCFNRITYDFYHLTFYCYCRTLSLNFDKGKKRSQCEEITYSRFFRKFEIYC